MGKQGLIAANKSADNPKSADLRTVLLAQKTELISELAGATANQFQQHHDGHYGLC